jgi:uncharacterized membrane protein
MMNPILILFVSQAIFSSGDLMARYYMHTYGFTLVNFLSPWFFFYFFLRTLAMFAQLYLFTQFELGKNAALFGVASIMFANILGFLVLGEVLTVAQYIGVVLAVLAFLMLALVKV